MEVSALAPRAGHMALLSAILFVTHPVQTQAVTYIVQRFASLATCFYLLSLACYIISRLTERTKPRYAFYLLALISAVLAMKTKEAAFTLPLALYEVLFFKGTLNKRFVRLVPLLLTMLIVPLSLLSFDMPAGEIMEAIEDKTLVQDMSRADYLLTEFRVIVTYIRMLFFPINQNLDYDYPLYHSFFDYQVLLSFLFLLSLLAFGVYLLRRFSAAEQASRLVAFGIFWFFLALSVESTLIPLHVIFEHRVYLPSAGAFWALGAGAFVLLEKLNHKKVKAFTVLSFVLIPLVLSYATYARNNVWRTELSLWEDVVRKSPEKARGHNNLGFAYWSEGLTDKAIEHYLISLKLNPDFATAYNNLGLAYYNKGLIDSAMAYYEISIRLEPDYVKAYNNLGVAYGSKGQFDKAIEYFQAALKLNPGYAEAHNNMGNAYDSRGLTDKAIEHYGAAIRLRPDHIEAYNNLGVAYGSKGRFDKAIEYFQAALKLDANSSDTHYNLGLAYLKKGHIDKARREFEAALQINPNFHEALRLLERTNK
jgi:tetratricopeptide (TPR) repeat protein